MSKEQSGGTRGNVDNGQSPTYEAPIQGTDSQGNEVTVQFGRNGSDTLIADGLQTDSAFMGKDASGTKGHDHADGNGGYNDRGRYSG